MTKETRDSIIVLSVLLGYGLFWLTLVVLIIPALLKYVGA